MSDRPIAFLMGSDSDLSTFEGAFEILKSLDIKFHVRVLSAHRTPEQACAFARDAAIEVVRRMAMLEPHAAPVLSTVAERLVQRLAEKPPVIGSVDPSDRRRSVCQLGLFSSSRRIGSFSGA